MNKRRTSTGVLTPSQTRKRKRIGVTMSRAMLSDFLEAPPDPTQGMVVRSSNPVRNPCVIHKSFIPLPPDPSTVQQEDTTLDEACHVLSANPTRRRKPGRKQENDSVSPQPASASANGAIRFVDERPGLGQPPGTGSRRTDTAQWPSRVCLASALLPLPRRPWHTQVSRLQCCVLTLCCLHRFPSR